MKIFVCTLLALAAASAAPSETRDKRGIFGEPGGLLTPHLHHDLHHGLHHDIHHGLHHDLHHGLHFDHLHHDLHHSPLLGTHLHAPLSYSHAPLLQAYHSPLFSHAHLHAAPIFTDHGDHGHLHAAPIIQGYAPLHHAPLLPTTTIIKSAKIIHGAPLGIKHIKYGW